MRHPTGSQIMALPIRNCNLVFRHDRMSHQLRVQFRIQKGNFDLVGDIGRGEESIKSMRALLVGKWIKDIIDDVETYLLVVAVEINTENVASTNKRYSSKKQEIFGAKVMSQLVKFLMLLMLILLRTLNLLLLKFKQAVGFAISQFALSNALPTGVELTEGPNEYGSLLHPRIYRDIAISCMYQVEDIFKDMLVPLQDVPPFVQIVVEPFASPMVSPRSNKSTFKAERKSDYSTGAYEASVKKTRKIPEYLSAKMQVTKMLGTEEASLDYKHNIETMYILRCLDTDCSISSLFAGLDNYPSCLINDILLIDFKYCGDKVLRNKVNLLIICEAFLYDMNTKFA